MDKVLDLRWLREAVRERYCEDNGRPGIDPKAAVRLMLAGVFHGVVQIIWGNFLIVLRYHL